MDILIFLGKINLALAIFTCGYYLLLRDDSQLTARRVYIISAILISLFVNLLPSPLADKKVIIDSLSIAGDVMASSSRLLQGSSIPLLLNILGIVWGIGVTAMILRLLLALTSIVRYRFKAEERCAFGTRYFVTEESSVPFTMFGWIFIAKDIEPTEEIILHEKAHSDAWHWVDCLFIEMLITLFWYNPFVWYLRRAMRENMECMADREVIKCGVDKRRYQYFLVSLHYLKSKNIVATYFNNSQIKNRIIMMNKSKKEPLTILRYGVLPLIVFALSLTTARGVEYVEMSNNLGTTVDMSTRIQKKDKVELAPLYVVDGIIVSGQIAKSIDPQKISNITILKGQSAIDIYGDEGKGGAVVITLKSDQSSEVKPVKVVGSHTVKK